MSKAEFTITISLPTVSKHIKFYVNCKTLTFCCLINETELM